MKGRPIYPGRVKGESLVSKEPIGFYGGVDVESGKIIERGHPLEGKSIKNKILIFPYGKGSTVGSYIIYGLKKTGNAPLGIITENIDTVVASGVIIAGIPCIDGVDIEMIEDGRIVEMDGKTGKIALW